MDNFAFKHFDTPLFCYVDSDDILEDNFMEVVSSLYNPGDKFSWYVFACMSQDSGKILGTVLPFNNDGISFLDIYDIYAGVGDKTVVWKKNMVQDFQYPISTREYFMPETFFYLSLPEHQVFLSPEMIVSKMYLSDGLTKNAKKIRAENPRWYMRTHLQMLQKSRKFSDIYLNSKRLFRDIIYFLQLLFLLFQVWNSAKK